MVMTEKRHLTLGPRCRKCGSPTNLTSVEQVNEKTVNVFHCAICDKLFASAESSKAETFAA